MFAFRINPPNYLGLQTLKRGLEWLEREGRLTHGWSFGNPVWQDVDHRRANVVFNHPTDAVVAAAWFA